MDGEMTRKKKGQRVTEMMQRERERGRDDRVLTSETQQSLHITQLSWKINSLWSGHWCQQQKGPANSTASLQPFTLTDRVVIALPL